MTGLPPFDDIDLFDEAGYLRLHPGVAEAIMAGRIDSAFNHYLHHGRGEGRRPNDVDPDFYFVSYPNAAADLDRAPVPEDAAAHYVTLGRFRGYRPNASAPRVANGAAFRSPFGGFWTDQGNALDIVQGRLELERINQREAVQLRHFATEGYIALDSGESERTTAGSLAVEQAFTGSFPMLLFATAAPGAERQPWRPELNAEPVAALDPHMMSREIRDLLFDRQITDALSLIFEAKPKLTASRASLRLPVAADRDVAWMAHALPLQFATVTFTLEETGGNLASVWPGSHRLPDLLWSGQHICFSETNWADTRDMNLALARREHSVLSLVAGREPRPLTQTFGARTIRHANLIHATSAPESPGRWRSLTAWYCPSHGTPGYMEAGSARTHFHDGFAYSSGVYPAMDPLD